MTNESKQTAVQWYVEKLYDLEMAYNQGLIMTNTYIKGKREAIEQAKEREKQQMMQCYSDGLGNGIEVGRGECSFESVANEKEYLIFTTEVTNESKRKSRRIS